ncbi:hypothetical protein EUGRSUZ_H01315 [Eucalyptus grandis]|uniref:Uncharacterized protein n=2 Tax=Eucalyptus grandis TaxID=71139 RepID=A0ACC3JPE6_EUCGR|nr:hypothetical protein EUGRSUZ_H01315 [Eucalyptus grandis]
MKQDSTESTIKEMRMQNIKASFHDSRCFWKQISVTASTYLCSVMVMGVEQVRAGNFNNGMLNRRLYRYSSTTRDSHIH